MILTQKDDRYSCGGKADNLFRLQEMGFNVPPFVVVPAEEHDRVAGNAPDPLEAIKTFQFHGAEISALESELPPADRYAVRSSALAEDGDDHSFAGQFATFLNVPLSEIPARIREVWLSVYGQKVAAYKGELKQDGGFSTAVIVQAMINAEVSGVAFGINPVTGDPSQKVINAVYGLGEGLVSGELDADTYYMSGNVMLRSDIVAKPKMLVYDNAAGAGCSYQAVDAGIQSRPTLSPAQCAEIASALEKLQAQTGRPQDIEFAFCDGKFYLLQARPVTTVKKDSAGHTDDHVIWDNSNIIESYPGLTSPLTFSFILPVYEAVYRQMSRLMGVSDDDVEKHRHVFANMLGLLNGRVYYNLLNWYKALALLPGFSLNAGLMEKMMGVKERFELRDLPARSRFTDRLRVGWMVMVLLKNLVRLPGMKKRFVRDFNHKMSEYEKVDLSTQTSSQLMHLFIDFEQTLLKKWKAPLVNDFFAMIYFGVLQKLTTRYLPGEQSDLHNALLSGAGNIISTEPVVRCIELSELISADGEMRRLFLGETPAGLLKKYTGGELTTVVTRKIDAYLNKFGNRCVGELKLETITYRQDPTAFLKLLKSYVEQGVAAASFDAGNRGLRIDAESAVRKRLRGNPVKRLIFGHVLKGARTMVSDRENLRYERTRAFGTVREIFVAIGHNFHKAGVLDHPRDLFFLTKGEIFDFIKGTSVTTGLKDLVRLRKREYQRFESVNMSERIRTSGTVYTNDFKNSSAPASGGGLRGVGCCPGVVRAKVRVVRSPDEVENLAGDILVTSSTDPGWVTLFPTASGILVERGSLLSHSAIVSREMGKPCIVGISGLLSALNTGDEVEMNGLTGELRVLSQTNVHGAVHHAESKL